MMTERKRVMHMKMVLYKRPLQSKDPQPRHPNLKASKIGVRGLRAMMSRYFSGAADNG